jgi:hypothetical protein
MTVDDGKPGLRRKLNLVALGVAIGVIVVARACGSHDSSASPAATPAATLPDPGTSISKDHGASAGKKPGG